MKESNELTGARLTIDGTTVTLGHYTLVDNFEKLVFKASTARTDELEVTYHLLSDTPQETLETLFDSEYTISSGDTRHKLLVSTTGDTEEISVVYGNPELTEL